MEFDFEIISEEGDCPNPLFDSIMNAMNSMKEATADKIYQKIQKEGETNYSKPQVDRALASALKYGIFEVKNNRYRVRDDILDDEDTVYWKLQKKREQTPFRIQDDSSDKTFGPKLNPEKDNMRFRKMSNSEQQECPQCGRVKRPLYHKKSSVKKNRNCRSSRRKQPPKNKGGKLVGKNSDDEEINEGNTRKTNSKRKKPSDSNSLERQKKYKKINGPKTARAFTLADQKLVTEENMSQNTEKFDVSNSDNDSISFLSDDEQSRVSCEEEKSMKYHQYKKLNKYSSHCKGKDTPDKNIIQVKRSTVSFKSQSETDKSEDSSGSDRGSPNRAQVTFFENLPCSSRNAECKEAGNRNQYLSSSEIYNKQYERGQTDQCERKSEWMGRCLNEPQSTIIQSNNVLTIEPMDSLAFKSPEEATYIS